jgi:hypothetical protein
MSHHPYYIRERSKSEDKRDQRYSCGMSGVASVPDLPGLPYAAARIRFEVNDNKVSSQPQRRKT